ncbi:acetyl-CoA acyltransferase 2 [Fonticula alba]|uniref:Acetyl-CoA acyltransferase 2 n=1 Tax=Fonticula alba TaxID=691883 RepID=A0A058Z9J7_FONAL|nr:acetyl-CoA acyltransferase 2 [Fonticula alba]KCV70786.1 acetyl-CoA acyltransferase 2 [Fonticula alba]|eukprot:XP_009495302.1 acetyl-CoA acyltransferase 2 [Fonticula alba]
MSTLGRNLFIVAAKRTPFGTFGGALRDLTATDLAVHASKATLASKNIDPSIVDSVVFGNVAQTSSDAIYLSRHVALRSDCRVDSQALTVNRLCGSGLQAVATAAQEILTGEAEVVLAGGTESMSQAPFVARGIRFGVNLGTNPALEDYLWTALTDNYIKTPMAITAENLAVKYGITREEVDNYALQSQHRWGAAHEAGIFADELTPIEYKSKREVKTLDFDEHPRPSTTIEGLKKLKPVFKADGIVTAGGASGISDGASALIVASEEAVKKHGLTPLARIAGWQSVGVDPNIMGIGPCPSITRLLARTGVTLDQIGQIEINEAFAAQVLACAKELGLDANRLNINGGAIALGHPLGASGARILGHLAHQLANGKNSSSYALGSACIGGGQGIAVLLERA